MVKYLKTIIALFVALPAAFGQYDPEALKILEAMSDKYQKFNSFSAKIVYSLVNESVGVHDDFQGKITIKGDKFRLVLDEQEIVNDGKTVWTYLPDVNEVSIDNYDPDNGDMNPSKIYTAYKKGFKYLYLNDTKIGGQTYQIVDLVPEDAKKNQIFKIRLEINKNDRTLRSWTTFDKAGNRYTYEINDFKADLNVGDDFFVFDTSKYNGIEIIDLR